MSFWERYYLKGSFLFFKGVIEIVEYAFFEYSDILCICLAERYSIGFLFLIRGTT